jgi:ABC-type branched-subunit amino acid transport system substrate-binding protein
MADAGGKPKWFGRAFALMGALTLAACSTMVPKGPPEPVDRPPVIKPQPLPDGPLRPGIPTDTARHRVALLVPLSGGNAGVGTSIANATQLALLDLNNSQVRITSYDTATGAAAAAQRAIADGNRLILGPLLADDVRAVAPIARSAGIPVIAFSNDTTVAGRGTYVMGFSPAQAIARVVEYAREQGVTTYAGLIPKGLYGERASTAFLRAVEGANGQVVSLQTYDRSTGSLSAAVTRLAVNSPYQAILVADAGGTAAAAAPMIRKEGGGGARILGTELWNSEANIASRTALSGAWFASVSDGLYRQYATKYRARFGSTPYRLSSLGYDMVLLTVRIARDWRVGTPFPVDRLDDRGGFSGIDGAFRFGKDGVAERALEVQEIRGGQTVTVSPAPSGF